jgi:hypothetical protein
MKLKHLPVFMFLLLFCSCTIYREYPIDIYKPGELFVPATIENAAIVYRNFKYPGDTLLNFYNENYQLKRAPYSGHIDSILVVSCLNELAMNLKYHNIFKEVPVFPYQTFERHTNDHLPELPANLITRLSAEAHVGLLITLETFSSFFSTYQSSSGSPHMNEVITVAVWTIYDPEKGKLMERKTMIDTLVWDGFDANGNLQQISVLPPRLTALKMASESAGENFARLFHASWQSENRMYSIPPLPDFSEAAFFIEEGKWDEAITILKRYADDRNGRMAINARYNLALAYEMKDELNTAQKWLAEAQNLAESYHSENNLQMIQLYQKALSNRQRDVYILEQINNENRP